MKAAAFQELLESVRDASAYLRGDRKGVARTDRTSPHSVAAITKTTDPTLPYCLEAPFTKETLIDHLPTSLDLSPNDEPPI